MARSNNIFNRSFLSFFRHNVNGGMLLMIAAVLAMVVANSPWSANYVDFLTHPISLQIGDFNPFQHHGEPLTVAAFINDCLMAIFFFHVGLEIKREVLVGELSSTRKATLPIMAALGGLFVPVLIYVIFNQSLPELRGAAIPMATDIAFSLGVLSLLGKRVPLSLKVFLTALAVADDIGGILVIAVFYTAEFYLNALLIAFAILAVMSIANWIGVQRKAFYIIFGIAVWYFFLQSGVHSTIAGVLVAFTIPSKPRMKIQKYIQHIRSNLKFLPESAEESPVLSNYQIHALKNIEAASDKVISPLQYMEDKLHGLVNYCILPLFAFVNAGIVFDSGFGALWGSVTYGIALGLIIGKPMGIFGFTWLFVKLKIVSLPKEISWKSLLGVAFLGGIGFTIALFIANLAFGSAHAEMLNQAKMGIIAGSLIAGVIGYFILNSSLPKKEEK